MLKFGSVFTGFDGSGLVQALGGVWALADGDYGAQSNRTGHSEERITLEAQTSRVN